MTIKSTKKAVQIDPVRVSGQSNPVRGTARIHASSETEPVPPRNIISRSDLFNGNYDVITINHELGSGEQLFDQARNMFLEKDLGVIQSSDDVIRFALNYIANCSFVDTLRITSNLSINHVVAIIEYSIIDLDTPVSGDSSGVTVHLKAVVMRNSVGEIVSAG